MAPAYLADLVKPYTTQRTLRSSDKCLLAETKSRLKSYGDRAFSVYAPRVWNKIPKHIRTLDTVESFKKHLKTYLFKQAYDHV